MEIEECCKKFFFNSERRNGFVICEKIPLPFIITLITWNKPITTDMRNRDIKKTDTRPQQEADRKKLIQSRGLTQEPLKSQKRDYGAICNQIHNFEGNKTVERFKASLLEASYSAPVRQHNKQTNTVNNLKEDQAYLQPNLARICGFEFASLENPKKRLFVNTIPNNDAEGAPNQSETINWASTNFSLLGDSIVVESNWGNESKFWGG